MEASPRVSRLAGGPACTQLVWEATEAEHGCVSPCPTIQLGGTGLATICQHSCPFHASSWSPSNHKTCHRHLTFLPAPQCPVHPPRPLPGLSSSQNPSPQVQESPTHAEVILAPTRAPLYAASVLTASLLFLTQLQQQSQETLSAEWPWEAAGSPGKQAGVCGPKMDRGTLPKPK